MARSQMRSVLAKSAVRGSSGVWALTVLLPERQRRSTMATVPGLVLPSPSTF